MAGRHDPLRDFSRREVRAERDRAFDAIARDRKRQCRPGMPMPDFDGIHAMPMRSLAAREQEIDRRRGRASLGVNIGIAERLAVMPAFRVRF